MKTIVEKVINYCQLHPDHARLVPNELDASLQVSNMKIWPQKMPFRNDCPGQVPWPIFWMIFIIVKLTNWRLSNWQIDNCQIDKLTIDDCQFPDSRPAAAPAEDAQPAWGGGGRLQTRLNNVDNVDYETSATCFYNNVDYDDIYHIDNVDACSQNYNDHRNIKGNTLQRRQRQPSF